MDEQWKSPFLEDNCPKSKEKTNCTTAIQRNIYWKFLLYFDSDLLQEQLHQTSKWSHLFAALWLLYSFTADVNFEQIAKSGSRSSSITLADLHSNIEAKQCIANTCQTDFYRKAISEYENNRTWTWKDKIYQVKDYITSALAKHKLFANWNHPAATFWQIKMGPTAVDYDRCGISKTRFAGTISAVSN